MIIFKINFISKLLLEKKFLALNIKLLRKFRERVFLFNCKCKKDQSL